MSMYTRIIDLQKMNAAWKRVKRNHPASGVDHVSYQDFENNRKAELRQLQIELQEHRYTCLPVKNIVLYKSEKERTVSIFTMRDKVVQQSLANELAKIYEEKLSGRAFAYCQGKSALHAAEEIEEAVKQYSYFLKLDIQKFFDCINQQKLLAMLRNEIKEEDVLELILSSMRAKVLNQESGELSVNDRGIHQGSSLAPLLSNLYLIDFDAKIEQQADFYVRYADDILILGNESEQLEELRNEISAFLGALDLKLSPSKSEAGMVKHGFEYLGFAFSCRGRSITEKAEHSLRDRLEEMWLTSVNLSVEEKLQRGTEIVGGWEQYYRMERTPSGILEYAVSLFMSQYKDEAFAKTIQKDRFAYENYYQDLLEWFLAYWQKNGETDNIRKEYEQFFGCADKDREIVIPQDSPLFTELFDLYKKLLVYPTAQIYEELTQLYSDWNCYNKAEFLAKKAEEYRKTPQEETGILAFQKNMDVEWNPDSDALQLYLSLFVGREDVYAVEKYDNGQRKISMVYEALTDEVVKKHIAGLITAETYIQRPNATVSFMVIDLDISKKTLLQFTDGTAEFQQYLEKTLLYAQKLRKILHQMGLQAYVEFSGYRGYHLWVFFNEWIPARYVNMLQDYLEEQIRESVRQEEQEGIQIEFFPNKARIKQGKAGQCMKLPYGVHIKSAKQSYFVATDSQPVGDMDVFMKNIARHSLKHIKRVLGKRNNSNRDRGETADTPKEVDRDLSQFGVLDSHVEAVLTQCNLMRYLCQKARTTGYLGHFERLSVLYVFGHLGDNGKSFVHTVMEFTLNYQYHITEKFIQRLPEKPISCIKLRDQYKTLTAEYGCSCHFKRSQNCYPSPVLHAMKIADIDNGDITIPTSRTLSKNVEKQVCQELSDVQHVQELARNILELKRQKRGIDKNIVKYEKELQKIFDNAKVDCMEIDMGLLVRRRKDAGYEWGIEL